MKVQDGLITCECCFNEVKPADCNTCDNCHVFCNSCIKKGTELAMSEGKTSVKCFIDCNKEINLSSLEFALPGDIYDTFFKKKQESELVAAKLEGLAHCPHCNSVQVLKDSDKLFRCLNEQCMKITFRYLFY